MYNEKPRISVIMSVYNSEKYLCESIESILNQTYRGFEFIIINDGCRDNSLNIIDNYARNDTRIKVISRENKGIAYSINEGLKIAKGELIARMDADDISFPERFEKQLNYFDIHEDVHIIGTFIEMFGEVDSKSKKEGEEFFNTLINQEQIENMFLKDCYLAQPTVMLRKSIFDTLKGYNESYESIGEDYNLWLRAIKQGYKFAKLPEKLVKIRAHSNSTTRSIKDGRIIKVIINARLDYLEDYFNSNKKISYLIWGASKGGELAREIIGAKLNNLKLIGYIDKFKTGELQNVKIYKPDMLKSLKFDYIFIATAPGKVEANIYLKNLGFIEIKDYVEIF